MTKSKNGDKKADNTPVVDEQASTNVAGEVPAQTVEKLAVQTSIEPLDPAESMPEAESVEEIQPPVEVPVAEEQPTSVKAETHSKSRKSKPAKTVGDFVKPQNKWVKIASFAAGSIALVALLISGIASQAYKGKVMPGVSVAGISSAQKSSVELKKQLEDQEKKLTISFETGDKTLQPKLTEIGYNVDVDKTVKNALSAKRKEGIFSRVAFWREKKVPAVVTVNDTLLNQYLETNMPDLNKAPQDATLEFNVEQATFIITPQADGQGPNVYRLKKGLTDLGGTLEKKSFKVGTARKGPAITEAKLQPLLQPANDLVSHQVLLTGLGYSYRARPADIAAWVTPTPQDDGSLKLIIDSAKVQSYVESIGKKISSPPRDKKVVKDKTTGAEVVLQEGRDGTELADRQALANTIAQSLKNGQDSTQTMNITIAAYKTVNMEAYDKWIEVDLSEQRTTAYERASPVRTFIIASGTRGHETPVGEFAIWHKVRSQTMQGGSKADGSYYSIPNVEWVSYFYQDYALHGAWWREKFGAPASHGCVNMTNDDAHWVFDWAPKGTKVIVHA